ncbi:MAG: hypothetical protein ABEJ84_02310 [Halodesulfurarchaeum sp.]
MSECPKISIVVYGSVLNPEDLNELLDGVSGRVSPVRVSGFKRIFNQEASWRETNDDQRAVLNVVQSPNSWFNGVLIKDLSRREFREIQDRERGYRFIEIEAEQIEYYEESDVATGAIDGALGSPIEQDLILTTTGKKVNPSISPIPDYVTVCKEGAESWGQTFFEDFIHTTETNAGDTLSEGIDSE